MLHPQGLPKDSKKQPDNQPNEAHDPPVALVEESIEVPPWVVPPKLLTGVEKPNEGKAKGKTHPQQVPEWVANSKVCLLGHYGITNCRVEGCCNPGCTWSKGMAQIKYYCNNHCKLLKKKHQEQSA